MSSMMMSGGSVSSSTEKNRLFIRELKPRPHDHEEIHTVDISPKGTFIATGAADGQATVYRLWDTPIRLVRRLYMPKLRPARVSPGCGDGTKDDDAENSADEQIAERNEVLCIRFIGETKIVSGTVDGVARIWDVQTGVLLNQITVATGMRLGCLATFEDPSAKEWRMVTASEDRALRLYRLSGEMVVERKMNNSIDALYVRRDGQIILAASLSSNTVSAFKGMFEHVCEIPSAAGRRPQEVFDPIESASVVHFIFAYEEERFSVLEIDKTNAQLSSMRVFEAKHGENPPLCPIDFVVEPGYLELHFIHFHPQNPLTADLWAVELPSHKGLETNEATAIPVKFTQVECNFLDVNDVERASLELEEAVSTHAAGQYRVLCTPSGCCFVLDSVHELRNKLMLCTGGFSALPNDLWKRIRLFMY